MTTEERVRQCRRVGKLLALTRSNHKPEAESARATAVVIITESALTQSELRAHCDEQAKLVLAQIYRELQPTARQYTWDYGGVDWARVTTAYDSMSHPEITLEDVERIMRGFNTVWGTGPSFYSSPGFRPRQQQTQSSGWEADCARFHVLDDLYFLYELTPAGLPDLPESVSDRIVEGLAAETRCRQASCPEDLKTLTVKQLIDKIAARVVENQASQDRRKYTAKMAIDTGMYDVAIQLLRELQAWRPQEGTVLAQREIDRRLRLYDDQFGLLTKRKTPPG